MNTAEFICIYNNIYLYPFGEEICSIRMFIPGADNSLTHLLPEKLVYGGPKDVGQYVVKEWKVFSELVVDETYGLKVTVRLGRNMKSILLVTYLPTFLMNIINQMMNYITTSDKYAVVISVNTTCMMALTSVYLSISTSLPPTASTKPVEIWLLFNLAYPFIVIVFNILLQVIS